MEEARCGKKHSSQQVANKDLLRRVRMLEHALRAERAAREKQGGAAPVRCRGVPCVGEARLEFFGARSEPF